MGTRLPKVAWVGTYRKRSHWRSNWAGLPIDETTPEIESYTRTLWSTPKPTLPARYSVCLPRSYGKSYFLRKYLERRMNQQINERTDRAMVGGCVTGHQKSVYESIIRQIRPTGEGMMIAPVTGPYVKVHLGVDPASGADFSMISKWSPIESAIKDKPKKESKMSKKARIEELQGEVKELQGEIMGLQRKLVTAHRERNSLGQKIYGLEQLYYKIDKNYIPQLRERVSDLNRTLYNHERHDHSPLMPSLLEGTLRFRGEQIEALCEFLEIKLETQPAVPAQRAKLKAVKIKKS